MEKLICTLSAIAMFSTMLSSCNQKDPSVDPEDSQQGDITISETLELVVDGVSEFVIVRGSNASPSEITASTELQSYLKQISGVELKIVTDSVETVEKEIVVGKTNREAEGEFDREELGDEGFVIKTTGKKLWLVGGEQCGTLYSVYEFLEDYLGCRFFTKTIEKIPELKTVSIEKIEEDKQIPKLEFRFLGWYDYRENELLAKRRINFVHYEKLPTEEFGGCELWIGGHSFDWMLRDEDYLEEHPEYFAMDGNGVRGYGHPVGSEDYYHQLCLSNPEVISILTEAVRKYILDNPDAEIFHVSSNDNDDYCKCDECMKIYAEEGGAISGTLIRALNKISEAVSEELNGRYLMTYAYRFTRSAPVTAPADNIIIQFAPIDACAAHPLSAGCPLAGDVTMVDGTYNTVSKDINGWLSLTNKVMAYGYNDNFAHYHVMVPDYDVVYEDFKFYMEHNICGYFYQGVSHSTTSTFNELKCYLMSKLMWDTDMTKDEYYAHMDEFLENVYGPGWKSLKAYLLLAQEEYSVSHKRVSSEAGVSYPFEIVENVHEAGSYPEDLTEDMIRNYENYDWTVYYNWFNDVIPPRIMTEGEKFFEEALSLATTDEQRARIEKESFQLDYMKSYYYAIKWGVGAKVKDLVDFSYIKVDNSWIGATNKILTNFFNANPGMFTKDETSKYRVAIQKYVAESVYNGYLQYNKYIFERLKELGSLPRESWDPMPEKFDDIALSYVPGYWFEAQKLYGGQ